MNDYDVSMDELEFDLDDEFEYQDDEFEYDDEMEYDDEYSDEYDDEFEYDDEMEYDDELEFDEEVFGEDEELELAEALLATNSDEELEYFLGSLIRKAVPFVGRLFKGKGRSIARGLARRAGRFARRFLPRVGRRVNRVARRAGLGSLGNLSRYARGFFGFELEAMPPEEQELEVAKKVVGIIKSAAKNLAKASKKGIPPSKSVVKAALKGAVKRHIKHAGRKKHLGSRRGGRWVRKGSRIIVMGA